MVSYIVIINFIHTGCVYFTKWQKPVVAKELMICKHHTGDVPKPISDLFQTNNNYHCYCTGNSQSL